MPQKAHSASSGPRPTARDLSAGWRPRKRELSSMYSRDVGVCSGHSPRLLLRSPGAWFGSLQHRANVQLTQLRLDDLPQTDRATLDVSRNLVSTTAVLYRNKLYNKSYKHAVNYAARPATTRRPSPVRSMSFITAQCYASAVLAMAPCPSVRPSVTSRSSTKMAKRRITQITPHDSPGTLVF